MTTAQSQTERHLYDPNVQALSRLLTHRISSWYEQADCGGVRGLTCRRGQIGWTTRVRRQVPYLREGPTARPAYHSDRQPENQARQLAV